MAERLQFDILANDGASANISRVGKSMRYMAADVELAQIRVEKANIAAAKAVEKYGKDSLQAREALARLAKAEETAATASKRLAAAQQDTAAAVKDVGDAAEDEVGKLDGLKTAAGAAGAGAAALLVKGFMDNLNIEAGRAKLAAQLDLSGEDAAKAGSVAGKVFRDAFGEDMTQVNEAIRAVSTGLQSVGESSPAQLEKMTKAALTLADTFGVDVTESVHAASRMIAADLVDDSTEAFDVIAHGFVIGGNNADDMIETLTEYSGQFQKFGLTGEDALNLIAQGMKGSARDTDFLADAIKELSIRTIDGSKLTASGFQSIGLNADQTSRAIANGGESARTAFGQILDGLRGIEDPLKRNQAGVALFGTKWEDIGPQVFASLSLTDKAIGTTTGAIDRMQKQLAGTGAAQLQRWQRGFEGFIQSAAGAPGVLGAVAAGAATVGPSALSAAGDIGAMAAGLRGLNLAGGRTQSVMLGAGKAMGVLAAAQLAGAAFGKHLSIGVDTASEALREYAAGGEMSAKITDDLHGTLVVLADTGFDGIQHAANDALGSVLGLRNVDLGPLGEGVGLAEQKVSSLDAALASMAGKGEGAAAAEAFARIGQEAEKAGVSTDQLAKIFPQYRNALDAAANSQRSAATSAGETAAAVGKEKEALEEASTAALAHANALLQLRGGEVGYWAAVDATTKAVAENGRTLNVTTEAGRANRTALDGQASAALAYLQAMQEQGAPQQAFQAQLEQSRRRLFDSAVALGMSKAAARAYTNQILGIPTAAPTRATLDKAGAQAAAVSYRGALWAIPRLVDTRATFSTAAARAERNRWVAALRSTPNAVQGTMPGFAEGGLIPGPRSARDNTIIAAMSGEYVMPADVTARWLPALEAMRAGRLPGFERGGLVGVPAAGQVAPAVRLEWVGNGTEDAFFRWLSKGIRVRGGIDRALGA